MSRERSLTITVINNTENDLKFTGAKATSGSTPTSSSVSVSKSGGSAIVTCSDRWNGLSGSFEFESSEVTYTFNYDHPETLTTTVLVSANVNSYIYAYNKESITGHDASVSIYLYEGVAVSGASDAYVVPLASDFSNSQHFINSLFDANVRSLNTIKNAYKGTSKNGFIPAADFTGGQMDAIIQAWTEYWINGAADLCPAADASLIDLIKGFIQTNESNTPLSMWMPNLKFNSIDSDSDIPIYNLDSYSNYAFIDKNGDWVDSTVTMFLTLLAFGSHFVCITADEDLSGITGMTSFRDLMNNSGLTTKHDDFNSHYASFTNAYGNYYLDISEDFADTDSSFLLSFLNGPTVQPPFSGKYNTFIQLEGWQYIGLTYKRHKADYKTSLCSYWNISIYGATPYSEKRGGSIFLAPETWESPQPTQVTLMEPYVGAYGVIHIVNGIDSSVTNQSWLQTDYVVIPSDAQQLPSSDIVYTYS